MGQISVDEVLIALCFVYHVHNPGFSVDFIEDLNKVKNDQMNVVANFNQVFNCMLETSG